MKLSLFTILLSLNAFIIPPCFAFSLCKRAESIGVRRQHTELSSKREKFNPFGELVSGFFQAATSSGNNIEMSADLETSLSNANLASWEDIRHQLESKQTAQERAFRKNLERGIGEGSPLHKLRLFDESNREEDVRVTFYRDSASWCPYCQKVWMSLEEKRIPYRIEKVNMRCYGDKPQSFLRLQPNGNIPVAIIDGKVYGQSNDILYVLEQNFNKDGYKSLIPSDEEGKMRAQQLLRLERQLFSAWMYWLTGGSNDSAQRFRNQFEEVLQTVEDVLSQSSGNFFMGKDVSTVDFQFAPFLERMAASLTFFKGYQFRVPKGSSTSYPALNLWFDSMEQLDSYRLTKSDYYTHCWDLPPQLGGCTYEDNGIPFEKCINGERTLDGSRGSWELPLQPNNGGVEPDWTWCNDKNAARREAVERLSANHQNIVSFASRGAGKKGMPPFSAALSDPNAISNNAVKSSVDVILREISLTMLKGNERLDSEVIQYIKNAGEAHVEGVILSLSYLRDRIGVPRDMRLPAARQLRAHLNLAISKLL